MFSRFAASVFNPPEPPTYSQVDHCIEFHQIIDGKSRGYTEPIIWLYTEAGGRIPATYLRRKDAEFTVIVSHSVDEDLGSSCTYGRRLCKSCHVNVFCYEYTGYGISSGKPSERKVYADIKAAFDYLVDTVDLSPEQIILLGQSLGTGPTCELASLKAVRAVILVSPVLSALRLEKSLKGGARKLPGVKDMFENINKIEKIDCPILIVHGKSDKRIPTAKMIELWQKTQNPIPPFYTDGGHDDVESTNYSQVFERYTQFFDSLDCPVMDRLPPREKSQKNPLLQTAPLMRSHTGDAIVSPSSSLLYSFSSKDQSKKKRGSWFGPRKSFAELRQAGSVEVLSTDSRRSSSSLGSQPSTHRFRSLTLGPAEDKNTKGNPAASKQDQNNTNK